jgi:putative ABC transport system substrate-binding protein
MHFDRLKRRDFISLLGGAASWPLGARAQQATIPVIGFVSGGSPDSFGYLVSAFRQGLGDTGYVEGRNVAIEFRWAEGRYDRLPSLLADLVRRQVSVLAATTTPGAFAAKAATTLIPIVFATDGDPVQLGLVASLSRPGGNLTGVTQLNVEVAPKRVELAHELIPTARTIALLVNPANPLAQPVLTDSQAAAYVLGLQLHVLEARNEGDFDGAFKTAADVQADALVIASAEYSAAGPSSSARWRCATVCPRSISSAALQRPAAWRATAAASSTRIAKEVFTRAAS